MNIEDIREYCIQKREVTEEFPFDEVTLVFKVLGKGFLFTGLDREIPAINLKCEPERAIDLRETYSCILPGYHMNKKHWNTVELTGEISNSFIFELIDHSYDLVVGGMTKKQQVLIKGNKS